MNELAGVVLATGLLLSVFASFFCAWAWHVIRAHKACHKTHAEALARIATAEAKNLPLELATSDQLLEEYIGRHDTHSVFMIWHSKRLMSVQLNGVPRSIVKGALKKVEALVDGMPDDSGDAE